MLWLIEEMAEKTSPGIMEYTDFHYLNPQIVLCPLLYCVLSLQTPFAFH